MNSSDKPSTKCSIARIGGKLTIIPENNIIETVLTACTGYDLAYRIPEWVLLLVIFVGFILIALKKNAYEKMSKAVNPYGDGLACGRIVNDLK